MYFKKKEIFKIMYGGLISQCIYILAKYKIPDILQGEPKNIEEISQEVGLNKDKLLKVFRVLEKIKFLQIENERYALTSKSGLLLSDNPNTMRNVVLRAGSDAYLAWSKIDSYLQHEDRSAYELYFNVPFFEHLKKNKDSLDNFNLSMTQQTTAIAQILADKYDLTGITSIADIGGGLGIFLKMILKKYDHLRGYLLEQESLIDQHNEAKKNGQDALFYKNVKLIKGDFFEKIDINADIYILKYILHDWSKEKCIDILRRIALSMHEKSRILIVEKLINSKNMTLQEALDDLGMSTVLDSKERNITEFNEIFISSNLRLNQKIRLIDNIYALELLKIK